MSDDDTGARPGATDREDPGAGDAPAPSAAPGDGTVGEALTPLLPLLLAVVAGVIAPFLAHWGEGGGPSGGAEGVAYGLASLLGWPALLLGPALVAGVESHRAGGAAGLAALLWMFVTAGLVGLGLLIGFSIACDGTCLS